MKIEFIEKNYDIGVKLKEIIENLNKWRDTLVHGQKGSILLRCTILQC